MQKHSSAHGRPLLKGRADRSRGSHPRRNAVSCCRGHCRRVSTQSRLGRGVTSRLSRLHAAQRSRCFYCRREMRLRLPGEPPSAMDATIDHFFPRSQGGPDGWTNWVLACQACNHRKASREPSPEEMNDWNRLAAVWQYIRPIDPALIHTKRCEACHGWISPMRLRASLEAGAETRTCRSACSRSLRRARQQVKPSFGEAASPSTSAPVTNTRARMTFWDRLLAWTAVWCRRFFQANSL